MKKQSFMLGSVILIASVIITKLFGFIFKIPLANMIGGTGLGYFSCAYNIFLPVYAISVTGLPAAVSKMVAENMAFGRYSNVRKIRKVALTGFSAIGVFGALIIAFTAYPITKYFMDNSKSVYAVIAVAPCILFGAIISVYRGYYEGLRNMIPTAVSQIIEAVVKMAAGLGFAYGTMLYAEHSYETTGKAFGIVCNTLEEAKEASLPFVAAAAILGVTVSTFVSCIYMIIRFKIAGDGITKKMISSDTYTDSGKALMKSLLLIVIPVAIGSIVTNLTSLIDLGTIIRFLKHKIEENPVYFTNEFNYVFDEHTKLYDLPNFLYGSFTGIVLTIFNLVPSLTGMFGKGAIPAIVEGWAVKDKNKINTNINTALIGVGIVAIPAGLGLLFLSKPILMLIYSKRVAEVNCSWECLMYLAPGVIFLCFTALLFSMLQAVGRTDLPVKIMISGVLIKLFGNLILMDIPKINIKGAAISTTLCYLVIMIISFYELKREAQVKYNYGVFFIKPLIGGLLCAFTAKLSYEVFLNYVDIKVILLVCIAFGGFIYLLSLFEMNVIDKNVLKKWFYK